MLWILVVVLCRVLRNDDVLGWSCRLRGRRAIGVNATATGSAAVAAAVAGTTGVAAI